ncbi:glycosyltransferase [Candidatus Chloroploca sp. M-50]|uniref:Glycosyltransferase n=1 Tax=Candidatus Chloroploca mongolica TaxID=2528176 RepID=A0ABS4D459_9CHLR|nr:glycosyltransferase [Candidatus Chloroploca mongolica]MBP1464208.1 glycosyltransferase [Candidatus Chloroploca mongolica]
MDRPDSVSVIVIVKNGERFLAEALQSILDQTLPPAEILVVDGHSTDRTAAIAQSFGDVRYLRQPDSGISNAYNVGIAHAQGELIAFLSHDDLWMPDKLAIQVGHLREHPDCQYTVCRIQPFVEPDDTPPLGFRVELLQQKPVAYIMETLVLRRSVFTQVGFFDPALRTAEDIDWFARVFDHGITGHVCDQVLVHKRIHQDNSSITDREMNRWIMSALRHSVLRKRVAE